MESQKYDILLADDDPDDCMFFQHVLDELRIKASVHMVNNGVELMTFLESQSSHLPGVLFLDLNMPCKSGLECLSEIKENQKLKQLPVIICSTSSNPEVMDILYDKGAHYYIRKPSAFAELKSVIKKALLFMEQNKLPHPLKENFVIHP
ncbi:MAG TPA: response regulator [Chryseolinea sp.]|nr:response regulator [Chryseolinea sp.]HPM29371.1 response regulator [Chryseolinea sp.]